jgi:hypothetical protein
MSRLAFPATAILVVIVGAGAACHSTAQIATESASPAPTVTVLTQPTSGGEPVLLKVAPSSGAVGTAVTITGSGFPQSVSIEFFCYLPRGTASPSGIAGWAPVRDQAGRDFTIAYVIPAELRAQQGFGGGPTPATTCRFQTLPPIAEASFDVTAY